MSSVTVCNVCHIANNVKMYCVKKIELREVYRKLTNRVYMDQQPVILCYICHCQLQRCYKFYEMSCKAEQTLTSLSSKGILISANIAVMLDLGMVKNLTLTMIPVICINSEINTKVEQEDETVKCCALATDLNQTFKPSVCRVCLVGNVRSYCIRATGLQEIFENIMGLKLGNEDGRPKAICYICLSQLKRCFQFFKRSQKLKEENENASAVQSVLKLENIHNLSVGITQFNSFEEPLKVPVIKQEPEDNVTELNVAAVADTVIKCTLCSKNFNGHNAVAMLQTHLKKHIEKHPCNHCHKVFDTRSDLNAHTGTHYYTKNYECDVCGKTFTSRFVIIRHLIIHSGSKPYKCDLCPKGFNDRSVMLRHKLTHSGVKRCAQGNRSKPLECNVCGLRVYSPGGLVSHVRQHTGMKPYPCGICSKPFADSKALNQHATFCRYLKCAECDNTFFNRRSLRKHVALHARGDTPGSGTCKVCNKNAVYLHRHMKIHSGEKPFACSFCDKPFLDRRNMEKHELNLHRKARLPCALCDQTFTQQKFLNSHMKAHRSNGQHVCSLCGREFYKASYLRSHLKRFHKKCVESLNRTLRGRPRKKVKRVTDTTDSDSED